MELRKDYILDKWAIISEARGKRPHDLKIDHDIYKDDPGPEKCHFCPGNEDHTPGELGRIGEGNAWKVRWFPNKFPAVEPKGQSEIITDNKYFTYSSAYGHHEIIVETPDHKKQMWDLDEERLSTILKIYATRILELHKEPNTKYVSVFKNHGKQGGASLIHSHSQLISLNTIPPLVKEKLEALKNHDTCPYCKIMEIEKKGARKIFENDHVLAFAPYASMHSMESWIFPKNHYKTLHDFGDEEILDLAICLKHILSKLKEINASFNMILYYAPKDTDMHFHIEIKPRVAIAAGFELQSGIYINSVSPEQAAAWFRGEQQKESEQS